MSTVTKKHADTTFKTLVRTLYENEIDRVSATFSGSCDSGTICDYTIFNIDDEPVTQEELSAIHLIGYMPDSPINEWGEWHNGNWRPRDFASKPLTLFELIETVIYKELEATHGGWEIDAGSSGTITITANKNKIGQLCAINADNIDIEINYNEEDDEYDEDNE